MNSFESGARKVIPAVLVYLRFEDQILMIHKTGPGFHGGRWNGVGGKVELEESFLEAAMRETEEEATLALEASRFRCVGFLQFPNFKPARAEDWLVQVFVGNVSRAEYESISEGMKSPSDEGDLHWVPVEKIDGLYLWPGDREFLRHLIAARSFAGAVWYRDGEVVRSEITVL